MALQEDLGGGHAAAPTPVSDRLRTSLGVELLGFSRRMLGDGPAARAAVTAALARTPSGRLATIIATAEECRHRAAAALAAPAAIHAKSLDEAVAAELATANAALPSRHREALVLRETLRLSYAQIAEVMSLDVSAIEALLARARLRLWLELRGDRPADGQGCDEREHTLRVLARRQDSESLGAQDDRWVLTHLAGCPGCTRAHAQMLEASVRYRAWALT